jgi:tripartite-type tricarboxylate transporter receptor subunit TctC
MKKTLLLLATLAFHGAVSAQVYPARAVKVIVPWPPGQATDIAARVVAEKLQQALGQPFVIDNRAGAGGSIGTDVAVKSAPDGYTLLAASSGPISIMPHLQKTPYDPNRDFAPVSLVALVPFALVTHPSFPANNAKEFIAKVRANPDQYTFSSSGTGASAHLITELFNSMAQLKARHVPYKGSAPALTDVVSGQIGYTIETVAGTLGHIKAGRLKTFGTSFARRTTGMPEVPTLAEAADLPDYDIGAWIGYTAPPGTPRDILVRLSGAIQKAMQAPELKERYLALGLDPVSSTPDEMAEFMRLQQERYGSIIKSRNIKIEQ